MSLAYTSTVLDHPADEVWRVLGDFHGMPAWVSIIASGVAEGGEGRGPVGSVRRLTLAPEGEAAEVLLRYDDPGRSYTYGFAGQIPFPVHAYEGTVRLRPVTDTGTTFLEWYGEYSCDAALDEQIRATFTGIYTRFATDLRGHLAGSA